LYVPVESALRLLAPCRRLGVYQLCETALHGFKVLALGVNVRRDEGAATEEGRG